MRLFLQAASAIAFAHSKGVIHRDLKPHNIMIGPFEEVLVLDWGSANVLDEAGSGQDGAAPESIQLREGLATNLPAPGTPRYMAPELLDGGPASPESDIFSLGVILYELLALQSPWRCSTIAELRAAMQRRPPCPTRLQPTRDIPQRLADVVFRAIAPEPQHRYATVNGFSHDIAHAIEGRATWMPSVGSDHTDRWRLAGGQLTHGREEELVFSSKGRRNSFSYLCETPFPDNVRVAFEVSLPRGRHNLSVLLNASEAKRNLTELGYSLAVVVGKSKVLSLLRRGRDVSGSTRPELRTDQWHRVVAARMGRRISLQVDAEEIYAYIDPIPLHGGSIALTGRSTTGVRIRNLEVFSQGVSASVSCLAVPDAFFNRQLYEEARDEYARIAASLPGHREGREAAFRSGLCIVERSRSETDENLRRLLLDDAEEAFASLLSDKTTCLLELGHAIVASEKEMAAAERNALVAALTGYPGDPQLPMVREWILSRLHAATSARRQVTAQLVPIAARFCMSGSGQRVVRDLIRSVRRAWEMPPFMGSRLRGKLGSPLTQAEILVFFGFWTARVETIMQAVDDLVGASQLLPRIASDIVFSLLELGSPERARKVLEQLDRTLQGKPGQKPALRRVCESAICALEGDLPTSAALLEELDPDSNDRLYNSARLTLTRAIFATGRTRDALQAMRPRHEGDDFAREHRAWLHLMARNSRSAERELAPLLAKGRHREGRDMTNFLQGAWLLLNGRPEAASRTFEMLPADTPPRTWTLGSYYAAGRLGDGDVDRYLSDAFPWERRWLYTHMALLARVRGDDDEFETCWHVAREPLAEDASGD